MVGTTTKPQKNTGVIILSYTDDRQMKQYDSREDGEVLITIYWFLVGVGWGSGFVLGFLVATFLWWRV
jgi:hypothetical protein